jgi:hypothetical protein
LKRNPNIVRELKMSDKMLNEEEFDVRIEKEFPEIV